MNEPATSGTAKAPAKEPSGSKTPEKAPVGNPSGSEAGEGTPAKTEKIEGDESPVPTERELDLIDREEAVAAREAELDAREKLLNSGDNEPSDGLVDARATVARMFAVLPKDTPEEHTVWGYGGVVIKLRHLRELARKSGVAV